MGVGRWLRVAWMCVLAGCAGAGPGGPGVSTVTLGAGSDSSSGGGTQSDSSSSTGAPSTSTSSGAVTPGESSSSSGAGETSSTTGPSEEVCDGMDNDGDGLTDEVSASVANCELCALHQEGAYAYWICDNPLNWVSARAACQVFGADLASIETQEEDDFLRAQPIPPAFNGRWIGGSDAAREDFWLWIDGTPWGYEGWAEGEPNNFDDIEHHLELSLVVDGWADRPEARESPFACKAAHEL